MDSHHLSKGLENKQKNYTTDGWKGMKILDVHIPTHYKDGDLLTNGEKGRRREPRMLESCEKVKKGKQLIDVCVPYF